MKALTVEEYEWLQDGPAIDESDPIADAPERLIAESCVARGWVVELDIECGDYTWANTPHGDRAVRVHRAWLQSMGVHA